MKIVWYGGKQPCWKWRPYFVRKSQWGGFTELHLGFMSLFWMRLP